jgi:hypothetical protein
MPPRKRSKPNPPQAEADTDAQSQSQSASQAQGREPQISEGPKPNPEQIAPTERANLAEPTENAQDGTSTVSAYPDSRPESGCLETD